MTAQSDPPITTTDTCSVLRQELTLIPMRLSINFRSPLPLSELSLLIQDVIEPDIKSRIYNHISNEYWNYECLCLAVFNNQYTPLQIAS